MSLPDPSIPRKVDAVADALRALLPTHRATGRPLPSLTALCSEHHVSAITARGAYERLVRQGLVVSRPGCGYFATPASRSARQRLIALLIGSTDQPLFAGIARGADAVCRLAGYRLTLALSNYQHDEEQRQLVALANEAAGVIAIPLPSGSTPAESTPTQSWAQLRTAGVPTVFVDSRPPGLDGPLVALDNQAAGALVTEHLLAAQPAQLIALVGQRSQSAEERLAGCQAAAAAAGAAVEVFHSGQHNEHAGEAGILAYLARAERRLPVAVLACNDRIALGCCRAVRDAGFVVGRDVLVAGFDDLPLAAVADPPLTSVPQDAERYGRQAAAHLLAVLRGETPEAPVRLPPALIVRASSRAASTSAREAV